MYLAGTAIHTYSKTQGTPALSSCEAELYAAGSAATVVLGAATMLDEMGIAVRGSTGKLSPPVLGCDSKSALQIMKRRGAGRMKHIELRFLAMQAWRQQDRTHDQKIPTEENTSDFLTRQVDQNIFTWCCQAVGISA